jgi:hypothetical protein
MKRIRRWVKILDLAVNWQQFTDMAAVGTWIKINPGMSDGDIEKGTRLSKSRVEHALHVLRFMDRVAVYRVSEHRRVYYPVGKSA